MRIYYLVELPGQKFAGFYLFTKLYPVCFKKSICFKSCIYEKPRSKNLFSNNYVFVLRTILNHQVQFFMDINALRAINDKSDLYLQQYFKQKCKFCSLTMTLQKFAGFYLFTQHYLACFKKNPFALNPVLMKNHDAKNCFKQKICLFQCSKQLYDEL